MSYNVAVNEIPEQRWFSDVSKKVVESFNTFAKNNKMARLVLEMYEEPETKDELECMLEEGMYDFSYPSSNPHSKELKEMVEEAEKYPRYLGFGIKNLDL